MAILASLGVVASAQAAPSVTTVASGLDNPRDLAFGPDGRLYVAEAGHGGTECITGGEEGTTCVGFTSGISRIDLGHSSAHRVVSGIVSFAGEDGSAATGVDGISWLDGKLYGIITGSSDAAPPTGLTPQTLAGAKAQAGRLIKVSRWGKWKTVADVGHTDFAWSNDHQDLVPGQFPDANPYGVLAVRGTQWVVDAGSNTIDRVHHGHVSVVQFIPNPPASDSVPTCIDQGRDGALYIGELTGGGNMPGAARVWRYAPRDSHPLTQWASGLTAVTGCGFGHDGRFYATEFSTLGLDNGAPGTGAVVRVPAHSTAPITVASGLNFPGGFAAGRRCSLYVSNWSIAPADSGGGPTGEVVRIGLGHH
jgi:hypothetical protein